MTTTLNLWVAVGPLEHFNGLGTVFLFAFTILKLGGSIIFTPTQAAKTNTYTS